MIKGRTPNIRTDQLRTFTNKLVASAKSKYGDRAISKERFNKLLAHAPVEYASELRGQKFMSTHQTKKFLGAFMQHIQEHPEYKVSTYARKALNVRLHQGDNVIQNFDPEHIGEKGLSFVAKVQQEADAAKQTGPTEEELKRLERRKQANILIGRSQRLRAEDATKRPSGFAQAPATAGYATGRDPAAGSSVTVRGKDVQTSVTGETKTAGTVTPIPGQPTASAKPPARTPVQLAGGLGIARIGSRPSSAVPAIGAPDTRGTASPTTPEASPTPGTPSSPDDAPVPAPPADTEATPDTPANVVKLPTKEEMDDVDKNLPLAA